MQRVGSWTELLRVFDGELNPIYCHSRLVCHFEFDRCRPRFCLRLNQSENLMHNLRDHRFNTPSRRSFALPAKPTARRSRFRTRTREAVIVLKALESWGNLAVLNDWQRPFGTCQATFFGCVTLERDEHHNHAQIVLGSMLADAINGFPVPHYPRCLQKAHENATLVDFDFDVLQDFIDEGVRGSLGVVLISSYGLDHLLADLAAHRASLREDK